MTCGIYLLGFNNTDKVYVGQSKHIETRFAEHLYKLKIGKASVKLQEAYVLYGIPKVEIILECSEDELDTSENEAIEIFNSVLHGFNTLSLAQQMPSPNNSGELSGRSVYSNSQIEEVFWVLYNNCTINFSEISDDFNIHISTIRGISSGRAHTWLKDKYPKEYEVLMSYKGNRVRTEEHLLGIGEANSSLRKGIMYQIVSPEGTLFNIDNVRAFAREHNLNQGNLHNVLSGRKKSIKGWKPLNNK